MKYWYLKEDYNCGHTDFHGFRELIYKGEKTPIKFLVRYTDEDLDIDSPKEWLIEWKELKNYKSHVYPRSEGGMIEITEEEVKKIIEKKTI